MAHPPTGPGRAAASGPQAPERVPNAAPKPPGRPDYKVYRSRAGPLSRLRLGDRLRLPRRGGDGSSGGPREITPGRVAKVVAGVAVAWIVLSAVLFGVSAQTTRGVPERTEQALAEGGGGTLLAGSTILVLGSDERPQRVQDALAEQGSDFSEGGRADSIMLLHAGLGNVNRLSILRDSVAEIPGQGTQRINAAYFYGGPPLMIETVESFMGNDLQIDHVILVSFERFPDLIDALGGIDVTAENEICAEGFDGAGDGLQLEAGKHHLDGRTALTFARVRKNDCAPEEDDRARAARQQEVFSGIRSQALSPSAFLRLPLVGWEAPRAIRTDLRGPGLAMLFADLLTGGTGESSVLEPTTVNPDGSVTVSEESRAQAVDELLGRD